jgi:hypothetical protein
MQARLIRVARKRKLPAADSRVATVRHLHSRMYLLLLKTRRKEDTSERPRERRDKRLSVYYPLPGKYSKPEIKPFVCSTCRAAARDTATVVSRESSIAEDPAA